MTRFLSLFAILYFGLSVISEDARADKCGVAFVKGVSQSQAQLLLGEIIDDPSIRSRLLGALRVESSPSTQESGVHYLIIGAGLNAREVKQKYGLHNGGNEDQVLGATLFARNGTILDVDTAKRVRWGRITSYAAGLATTLLLFHELANPGVIPNSLPMVPAIAGGLFGGKILRNIFALKRRFFSKDAWTASALSQSLTGYLKEFHKTRFLQKLGITNLFRPSFWRARRNAYLHFVDLGEYGDALGIDIEKRSPDEAVEVALSVVIDNLRESLPLATFQRFSPEDFDEMTDPSAATEDSDEFDNDEEGI